MATVELTKESSNLLNVNPCSDSGHFKRALPNGSLKKTIFLIRLRQNKVWGGHKQGV